MCIYFRITCLVLYEAGGCTDILVVQCEKASWLFNDCSVLIKRTGCVIWPCMRKIGQVDVIKGPSILPTYMADTMYMVEISLGSRPLHAIGVLIVQVARFRRWSDTYVCPTIIVGSLHTYPLLRYVRPLLFAYVCQHVCQHGIYTTYIRM